MAKRNKVVLFTLSALEKMGVASHSHLKKVMQEVAAGKREEYKGYRFVSPGNELKKRNFWLAYKQDSGYDVDIVNEPEQPASKEDTPVGEDGEKELQ